MKPIRLEMNAFLSYKDKEVIDFKNFDGKLFLIDGVTGAGKTTIFDALCYALYGEASNSIRSSKSFKSDYADINTLSYVDLIFIQSDKMYHVRREPAQYVLSKRKNKDGNYEEKFNAENVLLEFDSKALTKTKEVNEAIKSILHLDINQFRQTMMIAQGKFSELVQADTSKRQELFREILGTEPFKQFELKISDLAKEAKREIEEANIKMDTYLKGFESNNDETKKLLSDSKSYLNDYTLLKDTLLTELEINKKDYEAKKQASDEQNNLVIELSKKLSETKSSNEKLNNYKLHLENFNRYKEKELKYTNDRKLVNEYNDSYSVYNIYSTYLKTKKTVEETNDKIKDLNDKLISLEKEYDCSKENYKKVSLIDKNILEKNNILNKLIDSIHAFDDLKKSSKELERYKISKKNIEDEILKYTNEETKNVKDINLLKEYIEKHKDARVKNEEKKYIVKNIKTNLDLVESDLKKFKELNKEESNLNIVKESNDKILLKYTSASKEAIELENKYLLDQAGILAFNLKDDEACPVCGSKNHPKLGEIKYHITKENVDNVKKEAMNLLEEYNKEDSNYKTKKATLEQKYKQLIESISLIGDVSLESFENDSKIIINSLKKKYDNEFNELENINNIINEIDEKTRSQKSLEKRNDELKTIIENKRNDYTNIISCEAQLESEIKQLNEKTNGKDVESLNVELAQINADIKNLNSTKENYITAYQKVEIDYNTCKQSIKNETNNLENNKTRAEEEFNNYNKALNDSLLKDIDAIKNIIIANNKDNIKMLEANCTKYFNDLNSAKALLDSDINNKYDKIEYLDLTNIENELNNQKGKYIEYNDLYQKAYALYKNNKLSFDNYDKTYQGIKEKSHEAYVLSRLSDCANGHVVGQERIDFETYYQSQVFGNILKVASQKLYKMTDGTYSMTRHIYDASDGKASTSLDIDIFDTQTGRLRSSKSLSGGETFMTALSLALGFAEVIRNEAGARELDCMFIDEGFGSLDNDSLHLVLNVLKNLSNQNERMIGIISHVEEIGYEITNKINVYKDIHGSHLEIIQK